MAADPDELVLLVGDTPAIRDWFDAWVAEAPRYRQGRAPRRLRAPRDIRGLVPGAFRIVAVGQLGALDEELVERLEHHGLTVERHA